MRAIYPVLRKYCLVGVQGNHYLQVNENKRRVSELSISGESHSVWAVSFPRLALLPFHPRDSSSPRIKSPRSCCPAAGPVPLAQTRCQQLVPLLICSLPLLVPVTAAAQLTRFLRLALQRAPLAAAVPAGLAHCCAFLRQSRSLLALHAAALGLGRSGAQPAAGMGVPAGLCNNKTFIFLLTVLCTAIPLVGYLCWHP